MATKVKLDTKRLDQIIAAHPRAAGQIVKSFAFQIQREAQKHAPRDPARPPKDMKAKVTGALKNSIQAVQKSLMTWWVQDGVEYGIYQELGTSRMPARPFMKPAVERLRGEWRQAWGRFFKR